MSEPGRPSSSSARRTWQSGTTRYQRANEISEKWRFKETFICIEKLFLTIKVEWTVAENPLLMCTQKGKSKEVCSTSLFQNNYLTCWWIIKHESNLICLWLFPEGLSKLHSSSPSGGRRAAVRLRHARLSASVWLLGRWRSLPSSQSCTNKLVRTRRSMQQPREPFNWNWIPSALRTSLTSHWTVGLKMAGDNAPFDPSQSFTTVMVGE